MIYCILLLLSIYLQDEFLDEKYTGFYYNKNYIWAGAMNLAWTELEQSIIKEKIIVNFDKEENKKFLDSFNNPVLTK